MKFGNISLTIFARLRITLLFPYRHIPQSYSRFKNVQYWVKRCEHYVALSTCVLKNTAEVVAYFMARFLQPLARSSHTFGKRSTSRRKQLIDHIILFSSTEHNRTEFISEMYWRVHSLVLTARMHTINTPCKHGKTSFFLVFIG